MPHMPPDVAGGPTFESVCVCFCMCTCLYLHVEISPGVYLYQHACPCKHVFVCVQPGAHGCLGVQAPGSRHTHLHTSLWATCPRVRMSPDLWLRVCVDT